MCTGSGEMAFIVFSQFEQRHATVCVSQLNISSGKKPVVLYVHYCKEIYPFSSNNPCQFSHYGRGGRGVTDRKISIIMIRHRHVKVSYTLQSHQGWRRVG